MQHAPSRAENASQFDDLFVSVEKKHRIFRKRSDVSSSVRVPLIVSSLRAGDRDERMPRRAPTGSIALRQAVESQVLEHFSPPHVVANRDGDVVYYSSRTGRYFEAPAGVRRVSCWIWLAGDYGSICALPFGRQSKLVAALSGQTLPSRATTALSK